MTIEKAVEIINDIENKQNEIGGSWMEEKLQIKEALMTITDIRSDEYFDEVYRGMPIVFFMDSNRDHFVGDNKKVATGDHSVDTNDKIKLNEKDTEEYKDLLEQLRKASEDKFREGHEKLAEALRMLEDGADYAAIVGGQLALDYAQNPKYKQPITLCEFIKRLLEKNPEPKERCYRDYDNSLLVTGSRVDKIQGSQILCNHWIGDYKLINYKECPPSFFWDKLYQMLPKRENNND
jgi:ASC-1-like (ASCH) protein